MDSQASKAKNNPQDKLTLSTHLQASDSCYRQTQNEQVKRGVSSDKRN